MKAVKEMLEQNWKNIEIDVKPESLYCGICNVVQLKYKFYSQDLLNNLFKHPYTKIEFVVNDLNVSRITAANYLNKLSDDGILKKVRIGTGNYYIGAAEKLIVKLMFRCDAPFLLRINCFLQRFRHFVAHQKGAAHLNLCR